jgi:hypothetical protein
MVTAAQSLGFGVLLRQQFCPIGCLFKVLRGKIADVVGIEHLRNATDLPGGLRFAPNRLTQSLAIAIRMNRYFRELVIEPDEGFALHSIYTIWSIDL